ncbi:hypothetical protein COCNU_scaffold019740G000010 [Cocos nucifera]|nr:hypothetical protein [Cocos nucifera]
MNTRSLFLPISFFSLSLFRFDRVFRLLPSPISLANLLPWSELINRSALSRPDLVTQTVTAFAIVIDCADSLDPVHATVANPLPRSGTSRIPTILVAPQVPTSGIATTVAATATSLDPAPTAVVDPLPGFGVSCTSMTLVASQVSAAAAAASTATIVATATDAAAAASTHEPRE